MLRATSRACGRAHRLAPSTPRRLVVDTPRAAATNVAAPRAHAPDAAAAIAAAGVPADVAASLAKTVPPDAVRTLRTQREEHDGWRRSLALIKAAVGRSDACLGKTTPLLMRSPAYNFDPVNTPRQQAECAKRKCNV